jgi:hypothetical protein
MMKRGITISIGALLLLCVLGFYFTRPMIVVTKETPLWKTEYDASRQFTIHPGPGTPASELETGDRLRILWTTGGKDYRAYFVVGRGSKGWVLYGQRGIPDT